MFANLAKYEKQSLMGVCFMWGLIVGQHVPHWGFALAMCLAAAPTLHYAYRSWTALRSFKAEGK